MWRVIASFLTYIILSVASGLMCWAITNGLIAKLSSIPETTRRDYVNPLPFYFGVFLLYLFLTTITYKLIIWRIPKIRRNAMAKIWIGVFTGLLPITVLFLMTYGIPLTNPAAMLYFLLVAIAGGLIPIVERKLDEAFG